jgi:hypothetical protein
MFRRLGLGIAYFIAIVYVISIPLTSFAVSGMDARDHARAMLLCPPLCSLRLAQSLRRSHSTTLLNTSEKERRYRRFSGPGFSGLSRFFSRLFFSV